MGITVHYRGSIADRERVEDFEDRVLDLVLEIGASAHFWRSANDDDPQRIVKGLIVDLSPGQDTTSLLLAPQGCLVPLFEIEAAEKGTLSEPPWCVVNTQYGSVDGHVALVELLAALKKEFFPDLEVFDEGSYWENRSIDVLTAKFAKLQAAMGDLAHGPRHNPFTPEATKAPMSVARRLERVARLVQRTLSRPAEHPPVCFDDDIDDWSGVREAQWDDSYKEQRRKQERLHRAIEEQMIRGCDQRDAFESAMRNEGLIDLPGDEPDPEILQGLAVEPEEAVDESWKTILPETAWSDEEEDWCDDDHDENAFDRQRHPLQKLAVDFQIRLHDMLNDKDVGKPRTNHVRTLMGSAGNVMGGLAQAFGVVDSPQDGLDRGLALVQLKRALRGISFARGALFPLRVDGLVDTAAFDEISATLNDLESGILAELGNIRDQMERYDR
jgi:hypothetical protein